MNNLNEIYVATKDKEYVLAKIEGLCQKYNSRNGVNYEQQKALFRNYCHDTVEIFRECFETTMLGITRCISKVEGFRKLDNIDIGAATLVILKMPRCSSRHLHRGNGAHQFQYAHPRP